MNLRKLMSYVSVVLLVFSFGCACFSLPDGEASEKNPISIPSCALLPADLEDYVSQGQFETAAFVLKFCRGKLNALFYTAFGDDAERWFWAGDSMDRTLSDLQNGIYSSHLNQFCDCVRDAVQIIHGSRY